MSQESIKSSQEDIFMGVDDDDEDSQIDKYMLFKIGDEEYGINIKFVTEIIELQKITIVPDLPSYIKGVINLRGKVIPVLDVRLRFGMKERAYDDRTCIIIVNISSSGIGFVVDTVAEVQDIPKENIEPRPNFDEDNESNKYIKGLGKVNNSVKILLDVEKILYHKDLEQINEKTQSGEIK